MPDFSEYLLEQHPTPRRIDIYVDGSLLYASRSNPLAAAGWGAVVVERYTGHEEEWSPHASLLMPIRDSFEAEVEAVLGGLSAVQAREMNRPSGEITPQIVLHSDVHEKIKNYMQKMEPRALELRKLVQAMHVKIVGVAHDKTGGKRGLANAAPEMETAHSLANSSAWKDRARRQGGINIGRQK